MSKYIDVEKLIAKIERFSATEFGDNTLGDDVAKGALDYVLEEIIPSLQQEQQETNMKSPFTGGKVTILSREEEVTFRGEKIKITRKYYHCEDTGREFTDSKLDDDMMWDTFRAYCEKKGITSFTDIVLKQEWPDVDLHNNGWIDCRKQMPKETKQWSDTLQGHREWTESELVLAWDSMYGCRVDATKNGKWISEQRGGYTGQVVHGIIAWRPIPVFNEELLLNARKDRNE